MCSHSWACIKLPTELQFCMYIEHSHFILKMYVSGETLNAIQSLYIHTILNYTCNY